MGAGFLYPLLGEMRTMPGLPTEPAGPYGYRREGQGYRSVLSGPVLGNSKVSTCRRVRYSARRHLYILRET